MKLTPKQIRSDVDTSIFFYNQLNSIQAQVYRYEYPVREAFRLIPIDTTVDAGAQFVSRIQLQSVGRARVVGEYADDLPNVGLNGLTITNPIITVGDSYRYSWLAIQSAQMANFDLDANLAITAREAIEMKLNDLAFTGDSTTGMYGFLNNPNIPTTTVPNDGVGASTTFASKTPDQILRDLNNLANSIVVNSNGVEQPDTLLLPIAQYTLISSTARSANSDTTILEYFMLNNPYIRNVVPVPQLAGAGAGGTDIMIAYRNDRRKLEMFLPVPFLQLPPQERNLEYVINCISRFGGVVVYYPLSVAIGEGI